MVEVLKRKREELEKAIKNCNETAKRIEVKLEVVNELIAEEEAKAKSAEVKAETAEEAEEAEEAVEVEAEKSKEPVVTRIDIRP